MDIDITGLDKAAVLLALWRRARPRGLGYFDAAHVTGMTLDDARQLLARHGAVFDYVGGRSCKVDLSSNTLDSWLYDRDNGDGAASEAIATIR